MDMYSWAVGFVDGEGSFWVSMSKRKGKERKAPVFQMGFEIQLSIKEIETLKKLKDTLGVGDIKIRHDMPTARLLVLRMNEIKKIIDFFDKYSLQSEKRKSFELFKDIYRILSQRKRIQDETGRFTQSLTNDQINRVIELRNKMNLTYNKKKSPAIRDKYNRQNPYPQEVSRAKSEI